MENFLSKPQQHLTPTEGLNWQEPLLTVRCTIYNQEPFLRDCFEGFIMQETTFPFEVIVHDDASTDNSAAIIEEYSEKYPHIFKPIIQKENLYSQGKKDIIWNVIWEKTSPSSKYIAWCEGDDYWTKPYKLQKQVSFMQEHDEVTLTFHNAMFKFEEGATTRFVKDLDEDGKPIAYPVIENAQDRFYTFNQTFNTWFHPTASFVFRREVFFSDLYKRACAVPSHSGDDIMRYTAAKLGLLYCFKDIMSVYRMQKGGISQNWGIEMPAENIAHALWQLRVFHPNIKHRFENYFYEVGIFCDSLIQIIGNQNKTRAKSIIKCQFKVNKYLVIYWAVFSPLLLLYFQSRKLCSAILHKIKQ